MNYKNVFKVAESKDYTPTFFKNGNDPFEGQNTTHDKFILLECTLLQKWLRDTAGIDIEINNQFTNAKEGMEYFPVVYPPTTARKVLQNCGKYESALLTGVNAALQLI